MRVLAFDTSTEVLSVALGAPIHGEHRIWAHSGEGGAQASHTLIATVQDLLRQAGLRLQDVDAIGFGAGPGAFTGLRTACAVAQGLALGAGLRVVPVPSLLALAEEARFHQQCAARGPDLTVVSLLDARMGEVYAAAYAWRAGQWDTLRPPCLISPAQAATWLAEMPADAVVAGNALTAYPELLGIGSGPALPAIVPTAQAIVRLAPAMVAAGLAVDAADALPLYVRDKVAHTTLEREATARAKRDA
jgi:tRNA threonylcarbamoyladenosine biosynthesis protein TsaB